jgi:hypothetical protein
MITNPGRQTSTASNDQGAIESTSVTSSSVCPENQVNLLEANAEAEPVTPHDLTAEESASQAAKEAEISFSSATVQKVFWVMGVLWCACFSSVVGAQTLTLGWNPSPDTNAIGYELFYGLSSGNYTFEADAGSNTTMAVSNLTTGSTYYFAVLAYDASGNLSLYSNEVTNTVSFPPVIVSNPASQQAIAGATVTFSVEATGAGPLGFQWLDEGTILTGATNATLVLSTVGQSNAGNYSVLVSNGGGTVASSPASLSVVELPVITMQPTSETAGLGANVVFRVCVHGTPPFLFQWYNSTGSPIAAEIKPALRLQNITWQSAGSYCLVVQNAGGSAQSAYATLTITNAFAPVAGVYNGLFFQTNGVVTNLTVQTAGMLANCVVGPAGAYGATVRVGGNNYSLAGTFNNGGADSEVINRTGSDLSNLLVALQIDMTGESGTISGTVTNMATNGWTACLLANLATNTAAVPAGPFTLFIPPISASPGTETGLGSIAVTNNKGMVTMSGYLDDLTVVSQTVPMSASGTVPIYFDLYRGLGLAEGWVNLSNGVPSGTITWIRPSGILTGTLIPAGCTNVLSVY